MVHQILPKELSIFEDEQHEQLFFVELAHQTALLLLQQLFFRCMSDILDAYRSAQEKTRDHTRDLDEQEKKDRIIREEIAKQTLRLSIQKAESLRRHTVA